MKYYKYSANKLKRQHRDTLFRQNFKIPAHFIDLINFCNQGISHLTEDDIKPFDLDSAITIRVLRNDVSFITKDNRLIILIEHQSTINPNMALRLLMYYIELLQLWIKLNDINLYSETKINALPVPEFYVVYNGAAPLKKDFSEFTLNHHGFKIEIKVKIIDIHFDNLPDKAPENALAGYSFFYKIFEEAKQAGEPDEIAFTQAREESIRQGYLKGFIDKEDSIMFYKDFMDYGKQLESIAEARGEGKGLEKAIWLAIRNSAPLPLIEALAKEADLPPARLNELMAQGV